MPRQRSSLGLPRQTAPAYTSLDLFSGAGGFSLGLEAAGFRSVGAIDINPSAGATYMKNFGARPIVKFGKRDGDMRRINPKRIRDQLNSAGVAELDLLVAAPPCQGFSRVGRGKLDSIAEEAGAFILDPRNHLYRQAVEMLAVLRPRLFLFENVTGMLHVRGRNIAELVCAAVAKAGYRTKVAVLNSAWYGVPQNRERVIIVGARDDLEIEPDFPRRMHSVRLSRGRISEASFNAQNWRCPEYFVPFEALPTSRELLPAVTVRDAFADLPPFTAHLRAMKNDERYRPRRELMPSVPYRTPPTNWFVELMRGWPQLPASTAMVSDHFCRWTPRDFETFARMAYGDTYPQALKIANRRYQEARDAYEAGREARPLRRQFVPPYPDDVFDEKWRKIDPSKPCHTLTAHLAKDGYSHIHYSSREKRAITIREAARLQSFPDSFEFVGNMGEMLTQIGNAVPPLLGRALGRRLHRILQTTDSDRSEFSTLQPFRKSASSV